ncbi:MAG: hypothetical protein AB7F74_19420 [Parvibaculaceae bacterium]
MPALFALQPACAAEMCGKARGGQYAEEQLCANVLRFPDGKPATAAMLESIPESYPWLFPSADAGTTPQLTIKVLTADAPFTALQIINGWSPYDTTGTEASQFKKYGRAKDVLIETASGHSLRHRLRDTSKLQFIDLPKPAAEKWVRLKVLSSYPGKSKLAAVRWFAIVWEGDEGQ